MSNGSTALTHTTATELSPFLQSFGDTIAEDPGQTMQHVHQGHSVFLENLTSDVMRATGVSMGAARGAIVMAAKCLQGDPSACAQIKGMDESSPAKQAVCFAYCKLSPMPGRHVGSHRVQPRSQAAGSVYGYRTGDLFGDIANVVTHPDKAIASVSHDVAHFVENAVKNPIDTMTNAFKDFANMPTHLLGNLPVPGLKSLTDTIEHFNPATTIAQLANAGLHGDVNKLVQIAKEQVHQFQGVAAMIPGIGTGVSTALGLAEALLDGGNPIEVALRAAYSAIPIPPGIRDVTDSVFDAVMALLKGKSITDVGLTVMRDRIPEGLPRDVFDTLVNIVVRHKPIVKAAEDLALHEATKATAGVAAALSQNLNKLAPDVLSHLGKLPDPSKVFPSVPAALKGVTGLLSRMPDDVKKKAAGALAPYVKQAADVVAQHHATVHPMVLEQRKKRIALKLRAPGPQVAAPVKLQVSPDIVAKLGARAHLLYNLHLPI